MNVNDKQQLIFKLIKDELIYSKLVNGLNNLGLNADDYLLHLSTTIFQLMEIPDTLSNEYIYQGYRSLLRKAENVDLLHGHRPLDPLVEEIYAYLQYEKSRL